MAPPTWRSTGAPSKVFGVSGVEVAVPPDLAPGDTVVVAIEKELSASLTTLPAGWSEAGTAPVTSSNVHQLHALTYRAVGGEVDPWAFEWTGTAPYVEAVALAFPGAASSPLGTGTEAPQGAQRSTAGTATPNVALTTTGADRLLVWIGGNYNGGAWTPPTGFAERYDGGTTLSVASLAQASAGATGNVAGTCSASDRATARLLALVPGGAARRGIPIGVFL